MEIKMEEHAELPAFQAPNFHRKSHEILIWFLQVWQMTMFYLQKIIY